MKLFKLAIDGITSFSLLPLPFVFILKHYYGYKYEEISEIIGCPLGTVRSRLHNAVKYIMSEIERKEII